MSMPYVSPWRAFFGRFFVALVVTSIAAGAAVGAAFWRANAIVDSIEDADISDGVLDDTDKGEPANFLIIGSDTREGTSGEFGDPEDFEGGRRSDTIMIAHIDPEKETGLLVSFPRDLWVDVPGMGESKINAAFNEGPERVIETIQANFNIPIHHYLEVDFVGFREIVDAVGKVELWFPTSARDKYTGLKIPIAGCYKLNGTDALAYVRSRYYEYYDPIDEEWKDDPQSDIGRIRRQQYFIRSLAALAVEVTSEHPGRADNIANTIAEALKKDRELSLSDLTKLANTFRETDPAKVDMLTVPWELSERDGQSVLLLREAEAEPIFRRLRFEQEPEPDPDVPTDVVPADVSVRVLNGTGEQGLARATLDALAGNGFTAVEPPEDADHSEYAITEVRYAPGADSEARLVAAYLGVGELVELTAAEGADVVVVLGDDFEEVQAPAATVPTTAGETTGTTGTGGTGTGGATTSTTLPPVPGSTPGLTAPSRPDGGFPVIGC